MKKAMVTVLIVAMVALAACGPGSESAGAGAAPATSSTVPSDPTTYEAQEWATFRLVTLPTSFGALEESLNNAYNSTGFFYSPSYDKPYRSEVSPIIHQFDVLMGSVGPAVRVLQAAARAGARDNDLADLAPELLLFHESLESRLADIHEFHNATLAFDSDRWDTVSGRLQTGRIPQSFLCAFYAVASEGRWASRFTPEMNESIVRGSEIYGCTEPADVAGETSA